jgi:hypothetical protein
VSPLCSRNAQPLKDGERTARYPLCSQNAHDKNVLVRCAKLWAALAAPLERCRGSEGPRPGVGHVLACQWVGG